MYNMLIADADVDAWFRVSALLRSHLVKANFVTNLALAKQYLEKQMPALVFIDSQLLDNPGRDFIRFVKLKYPAAKIVLINSLDKTGRRLTAKADLVISRPIIPEIVECALVKMECSLLQGITATGSQLI